MLLCFLPLFPIRGWSSIKTGFSWGIQIQITKVYRKIKCCLVFIHFYGVGHNSNTYLKISMTREPSLLVECWVSPPVTRETGVQFPDGEATHPWASLIAQLVKNLPAVQETQVREQKDVMGKEWLDLSTVYCVATLALVISLSGNIKEQICMDFMSLTSLFNPKSQLSVK